jgi:hypothetical protein
LGGLIPTYAHKQQQHLVRIQYAWDQTVARISHPCGDKSIGEKMNDDVEKPKASSPHEA